MGGYGAVKLGLKHHDMFASVNSHSGALGFPRLDPAKAAERSPEFVAVFGKSARGGPEDPFATRRADRPRPDSCVADRLRHRRLPDRAESRIPQTSGIDAASRTNIEEFPGAHDWEYWDLHVREALAFHARNLKIEWMKGG